MLSLTRLSAAFSSLSQPDSRKNVEKSRKMIQSRELSIEVVSEGILTGGGGEVKGICEGGEDET